MIPRVARSGRSFQGAGQYYLHDKLAQHANNAFAGIGDYALHDKQNRQTAHRVGFTEILNMEARSPEEAIGQMSSSFERYREREANKRGRKLTKPVYAYSLSWAPGQTPNREEMLAAAHSSLKALRLEGLQTLIVQHIDEPQPHIHVIVNRIERDGSRARNIPFDQLRFSRWAEEYERAHGGILCEQRVANNAQRAHGRYARDTVSLKPAEYRAREQMQAKAVDGWQREQEAFRKSAHAHQNIALWSRQTAERDQLEARTRERIKQDQAALSERFRPNWALLYQRQAQRTNELALANKVGIFERAVFVYRHKEFLKSTGRLRMRDVVRLCLSGKALRRRVERAHTQERTEMAQWLQKLTKTSIAIAWREHREEFAKIRVRQSLERDGLRHWQKAESQNVPLVSKQPAPKVEPAPKMAAPRMSKGESLELGALDGFFRDGDATHAFNSNASPLTGKAYTDDLERRLKDYKKRNPGRDFDYER